MIIDAHYHLDERIETVDRLIDQMERLGINRVALIPTMQDPFPYGRIPNKGLSIMRKALMGRWHKLGLWMYRSLVTSDGKFVVMNKRYPIYDKPDNSKVSAVMQAHPDKFYGWIAVNPRVSNAVEKAKKWVGQPGWIGVKTHPFLHRYSISLLNDIGAYCSENGLPILIHLGADSERGNYRILPDRYPNLKVIYAHAGLPFYTQLWEYAKTKENVYIDLSSPFLDEQLRSNAIRTLGAQKCIYGSDGPYGYPDKDGLYDHSKIIQEILRRSISNSDKDRILVGNFKEIFNIK